MLQYFLLPFVCHEWEKVFDSMNFYSWLWQWLSIEEPAVFTFHRHANAKKNEICEMFSKWFEREKKFLLLHRMSAIHTHYPICAQIFWSCVSLILYYVWHIFSLHLFASSCICAFQWLAIFSLCVLLLYNLIVSSIFQSTFIWMVEYVSVKRNMPVCLRAFMWNLM